MRPIVKAAVRVIIFFLLLQLFLSLLGSFTQIPLLSRASPESQSILLYLAVSIAAHVVGMTVLVVIWLKTDRIAEIISSNGKETVEDTDAAGSRIVGLAMRVLGLYFIFATIPQLVGIIIYNTVVSSRFLGTGSSFLSSISVNDVRQWVTVFITLVVGTLLAWGKIGAETVSREAVTKVAKTIWTAGASDKDSEDNVDPGNQR